jgi:hypothetical protein
MGEGNGWEGKDASYLFPASANGENCFPIAAACHAAATDPAGAGSCRRAANVELPGPPTLGRIGRNGSKRRGCPNYINHITEEVQ